MGKQKKSEGAVCAGCEQQIPLPGALVMMKFSAEVVFFGQDTEAALRLKELRLTTRTLDVTKEAARGVKELCLECATKLAAAGAQIDAEAMLAFAADCLVGAQAEGEARLAQIRDEIAVLEGDEVSLSEAANLSVQ